MYIYICIYIYIYTFIYLYIYIHIYTCIYIYIYIYISVFPLFIFTVSVSLYLYSISFSGDVLELAIASADVKASATHEFNGTFTCNRESEVEREGKRKTAGESEGERGHSRIWWYMRIRITNCTYIYMGTNFIHTCMLIDSFWWWDSYVHTHHMYIHAWWCYTCSLAFDVVYAYIQPIAFGVSFNPNLQSQSPWSLFNGTWPKRPREVEHRMRFEIEEMILQIQ